MRNLHRFCATLSLALALSIPAMAGDVHTGKPMKSSPMTPVPPQVYEVDSSSTTGAISEVNDATSVDPLAELTLALLNGVLSIF